MRKTITVVFIDVTGSTVTAERLDPESVRSVMARYFDVARLALERHGGNVEKFIGDAVVGVFGIPTVREDDALRAVRAAAEIREDMSALNRELESEWGVTVSIRTGVNTGEVVAGDAASSSTLATGDAMNVAARLEQAAPPGEILIGERTYRLVKGAVSAEPVEPLYLKGKAEPVPAFRLLLVSPEAQAHGIRLTAPMLGRDQDLELILRAREEAAAASACRIVTVVGNAGVGKSRLATEALARMGAATVLEGRCLSYGDGITYWPLAEIIRAAAAVEEDDSVPAAIARIATLLGDADDGPLIAGRVAGAIGLTEFPGSPAEAFWAIRRLLEALAQGDGLVVVVDDLHWAEPTLLDLLEHVADLFAGGALLLLCLARPEFAESHPDWCGGRPNASTIRLEPLEEQDTDALIDHLLGEAHLTDAVRARITSAGAGNPLFLEEFLAMLLDEGLLERKDDRWVPTVALSGISVPSTIAAVLGARIDGLPQSEREVLALASVAGQVFYRGAVAELCPAAIAPGVDEYLTSLSRRDLIRSDPSSFAGGVVFRFRHILLRDAAYRSMPKQLRADLHEAYASWLERTVGERIGEYEEIVGYHLEQAYRYRESLRPPSDQDRGLAARAAALLSAAGGRAFARADMPAVASMYSRSVELLAEDDPARLQLMPDLAAAVAELGDLARAKELLAATIARASAIGDRRLKSRTLLLQLSLRMHVDPERTMQGGLRSAEDAVRSLEGLGDGPGLAEAWLTVAMFRFWTGQASSSEAACYRAVQHARAAGNRRIEAQALSWTVLAISEGPAEVTAGLQRLVQILEDAEGHSEVEARVLCTRAWFQAMSGKLDEAREEIARSRALFEDLGLIVDMAGDLPVVAGRVELLAGDPGAAEHVLRWGYEILERMGETAFLSTVAGYLAEAAYRQDRLSEALGLTETCEGIAAPDDLMSQILWRSVRARILARRGDHAGAERMAREAVQLAERTDYLIFHGDALMALADVLRLAGRPDDAASEATRALRLFERKGDAVSAEEARAVIEELGGQL